VTLGDPKIFGSYKIKGHKEDLLRSPMVEGEKSKGLKKIS
jgi:hypothetical protein